MWPRKGASKVMDWLRVGSVGSAWKRGQQQAQQAGLFLLLLVIGANGVSGCEGAGRAKEISADADDESAKATSG